MFHYLSYIIGIIEPKLICRFASHSSPSSYGYRIEIIKKFWSLSVLANELIEGVKVVFTKEKMILTPDSVWWMF